MKHLAWLLILLMFLGSLSGCLVRTGPRHHHHGHGRQRACPPSYHWNGHQCVHNGRGKGRVRDHRR